MFRHMKATAAKSARPKVARKKSTVKVVHGFRIRERWTGCYVLQVRRSGLNHFETFHSLDAAVKKCEQLHREKTQHGLSSFEITVRERLDASEAINLLQERTSLAEAARFWLLHNPDKGAVTVQELFDQYLAELERRNARPYTMRDARVRLSKFAHDHGKSTALAITSGSIAEWLGVRGGKAVNSNNTRKWLRAAFAFGVKRGILSANPVAVVEPTPVDERVPEHWNASRVASLLRAAQEFKPDMIPLLSVMAFAGLRPHEAVQLGWEHINLTESIIRVLPVTSKIRQIRAIDIPENLRLWLLPFRKSKGSIAPAVMTITRWRIRLSAASVLGTDDVQQRLGGHRGKSGVDIKRHRLGWDSVVSDAKKCGKLWSHDILRHSMATAWLAVHNDIYKLAEQLGNSPDVIRRHYKGLCTESEGRAYWEIVPHQQAKVVAITQPQSSQSA